jgi:chorismate dehydratase
MTMRVGRIPYLNCYPVYGAVDRGIVPMAGSIVDGVPTALNRRMAEGTLDISVVSAVEYARDWERYLLLPDLAISCDGPVRSVMLFSNQPAESLTGKPVVVSRSSMTSVHLLELLFEHVWKARPVFIPGNAEAADLVDPAGTHEPARLVIGDAALMLGSGALHPRHADHSPYRYHHTYDLGTVWKEWTGMPFVFAVWVAQRTAPTAKALGVHASLIASRDWGLAHRDVLAQQAHERTGVPYAACLTYLSGLDYGLSYPHLGGLTEFYRRLTLAGKVEPGRLAFLSAAA